MNRYPSRPTRCQVGDRVITKVPLKYGAGAGAGIREIEEGTRGTVREVDGMDVMVEFAPPGVTLRLLAAEVRRAA